MACDLLAALWEQAGGEEREALGGELALAFAALERPDQLARAGRFEALAEAGCGAAREALAQWLPAGGLLAGASLRTLRAELYALALIEVPVLLWGEQGTGHSLSARALHALAGRPALGFFELYARASRRRAERELAEFDLSPGATLYLSYANELERWSDWIPELCASRRIRLVIAMHTGVPQRLRLPGDSRDLPSLGLPPLRERLDDLPELVHALLARAGVHDLDRAAPPEVLEDLSHHDWPGNVRELANHVARALRRASDEGEIASHLLHDLYGLPGELGPPG